MSNVHEESLEYFPEESFENPHIVNLQNCYKLFHHNLWEFSLWNCHEKSVQILQQDSLEDL